MNRNDEQLEALLHEFEPRKPQPLTLPASDGKGQRRLAAAAVVILAGGASLWLATRGGGPRGSPAAENTSPWAPETTLVIPKMPLFVLTRVAENDPQKLDTVLDEESRVLLPGFQRKDSTLAPLAKE